MRFKSEDGDIRIYAVAGTQTVLLAFDIDEAKVKGKKFLGFSLDRTDKAGTVRSLNGSKHFKSIINDVTAANPKASLIQSYFWKDYTADPEQTYTYTVRAMFGDPRDFTAAFEGKIKVKTEAFHDGKHGVYFNLGVTGSQGYAHNPEFGNKRVLDLTGDTLQHALDYLSRELYNEGLLKFIAQAKTPKHSLYCAFYEIQYMPFLEQLKDVRAKCKNLEIVFSRQPGQNQDLADAKKEKGNVTRLKEAGLFDIAHPRTKANQPHNKFMVLCKDDVPIEVWTGSTNITISGIFGQCNTGHWIKDADLAAKYKQYWETLKGNPDMPVLSAVSHAIQPDTDLTTLKPGMYPFFSPRDLPIPDKTVPPHLNAYCQLIESATNLVAMLFPFNYDGVFKTVYDEQKDYLRMLIFEKASEAKRAKEKADSDPDLLVTAGAVLKDKVEQFAKEVTSKMTVEGGILYVHNKFFLIDPLGDTPVVVSGSANFSQPSIIDNDENSVLIKGDKRVADIYLTEMNRLFDHFWPRYLRTIIKNKPGEEKGFDASLDEKFKWFGDYFVSTSFHHKRGQLFIQMKGAKKG